MKTVLVRYKTRDDKAAENEDLVRAVFDELRSSAPQGLRYGAFKQADGSSFVHLALIDAADGGNPLLALDAFKRFQSGLRERCVEAPAATELVPLDAYGPAWPERRA